MKKTCSLTSVSLFAFSFIAAIMLFPSSASAHAPDLQLSYDAGSKNLTVTITHSSPMPSKHYIKLVGVKKNGASVVSQEYSSQPADSPFIYTYTIPAAEGDILQVTGVCSFFGSKTVEVKVAGKAEKTK